MELIADLLHSDVLKFKDIFNILSKLQEGGEIKGVSDIFYRILKNESKFTLEELDKIQKERSKKINISRQYEGNMSLFKSNFQLIVQLLVENTFKIVVNETQIDLHSRSDDEVEAQTPEQANSVRDKIPTPTTKLKSNTSMPKLKLKNIENDTTKLSKKSSKAKEAKPKNSKVSSALQNIVAGSKSSRSSKRSPSPKSSIKAEGSVVTIRSQMSPNMSKRPSAQISLTKASINLSLAGLNSEFNHVHGPCSFSQTERKLTEGNPNGPGPAYYDVEKSLSTHLRRSVSPTIGKASKQTWINNISNSCSPGPGDSSNDQHEVPTSSENTNSDQKPSLFNLSTPSQMKINNTSVVIRPNYGKIDLKLFVGQIPKEWDEGMVTEFFSGYGEILESQIIRDAKSGQSKGCAFVKFASMTKAEDAKHSIESKSLSLPGVNNPIQIRWADGEDQRLGVDDQTIPKLFVGSIPKHATEENLNDVFTQFGHIEELVLMKDPDGSSKGCAFIRFKNKEDALLAMRFLNGNVYVAGSDKPIEVRFAENKKKTYTSNPSDTYTKHHASSGQVSQNQHSMTSNAPNPMNSAPFYKYLAPDGNPYYLNPFTRQTQWEEPPSGSYVIPELPEQPYVVKSAVASRMPKKQGPAGSNLFIFHLPNDWSTQENTEDQLFGYFKDFGNIISCRIMRDKKTNRSRGFGFVSYDNAMSAQAAVQRMNGFQAGAGKRLKVDIKKGEDEDDHMTNNMSSDTKFTPY